MALNERQKLLEKIASDIPQAKFSVISIIFNYKEEITVADYKKIEHIIRNIKTNKAIIIYHGEGGETNAGFGLAICLRKKFPKQLLFFIPEKACSAHVLPVLLSNGIYMSEDAYLTSIDPSIYYYSKNYPCNIILENVNHPAYNKARRAFSNTANMVFEILGKEGSLIIDPDKLNSKVSLKIAANFLNPKSHSNQIGYMELNKMKLEVNLADGSDSTWDMVKRVHSMSILELNDRRKKFLVETSKCCFVC